MAQNIYLDESGDLGWVLDQPYRKGGSSRFMTIAFAMCPSEKTHLLKRVVRDVYRNVGADPKVELKGSSLATEQKCYFARQVHKLLTTHPDIKISAITVKKQNVREHIREDANKLYNYMIKLAVLPMVTKEPMVNLIRDNKSVKVKSGNSLIDYLQTSLWFDYETSTKIVDYPMDSKKVQNLIFIDWINNLVWGNYEDQNSAAFNIISSDINSITLFFH